MNINLSEEQIEAALARANRKARDYQSHVRSEGRKAINQSPDGCWHCGSLYHHSSDCLSSEGE